MTIIRHLALTPGTLFGPYRIVAPLGAGGMGEVYRARDSRLNREVALKFLRPEFGADDDRLQRFVREAQTLAALNHSHIAQIHGIEEAKTPEVAGQTVRALVMEFVDGEDLSDRIARGPLPLDESLEIARQIAEALEAAHEQGVVHRDLKPANVKVRRDGTVKVLDFGLAKALEGGSSSSSGATLANSPTIASPAMTAAGIILGTAAYMSPEQARAKPVDKRADIWAFGVVLYEMLTGRSAYVGETVTDLLAAVVTREPDWSALPESVPQSVRHLLRRCLEKDSRTRLRDIGEARVALTSADAAAPSESTGAPVVETRRRAMQYLPWAIAALVAAVAGVGAWVWKPAPTGPLRKLELALPIETNGHAVLSPDGRHIAFRSGDHIVVTDLQRLESRDLTSSVPSQRGELFWSPDSAFVAYFDADAKLWTVPVDGGTPRLICTIPETGQLMGATWHTNGTITLAVWRGSLYQVPSRGGDPTPIVTIDPAKEIDFHSAVAMPDGRVLVAAHLRSESSDTDNYRLELIGTQQREVVLEGAFNPVGFVNPGRLLVIRYYENPGLWAFPYSGRGALHIEDGVLIAPGAARPSAANDGSLLYTLASTVPQARELVWVDRQGQVTGQIGTELVNLATAALSPDGSKVAFSARVGNNNNIWVRDLQTGLQTRVTSDATDQGSPTWFPSGQRVAYAESGAVGQNRIAASNADGSGSRQELVRGIVGTISPDGRYVAYTIDERGNFHLRYAQISADGTVGESAPFFKRTPEPSIHGVRFSPDGRNLAYVERQPGGAMEVFVTSFPSGEGRWQVSNGGGRGPVWTRNGEIIFASGSNAGPKTMMAAPITVGPPLKIGAPIKLFTVGQDLEVAPRGSSFDAADDGRRLVMIRSRRSATAPPSARWILVQNWLSEFADP